MMKNSKLLAVVMAITMIGGLTGCGNSSKAPTGDSGEKTVQTEAKAETKSEASGEQKEESKKESCRYESLCNIPGPERRQRYSGYGLRSRGKTGRRIRAVL